jgi:hypothetical protein
MKLLAVLTVFLLLMLQLGFMYLLIPFILMKVLAVFGVAISFFLCVGIMFLIYFVIGLLK